MTDIFLSYASADRDRVRLLVDVLERHGWSVWWDRTILPGEAWEHAIETAINQARCVIVLWSKDSVRPESYVRLEANEGKLRRILVPVLLDDVAIPLSFRGIQAANLVAWSGILPHAGFDELLGGVSKILSAGLPVATRGTAQEPGASSDPAAASVVDGSPTGEGAVRVPGTHKKSRTVGSLWKRGILFGFLPVATTAIATYTIFWPAARGAVVRLDEIDKVDFRTSAGPNVSEANRLKAPAYLTVASLIFRSIREPAKPVIVEETTVRFVVGEQNFNFRWRSFADINPSNGGWLGILADANPFAVGPGSVESREIQHEPIANTTWEEILNLFVKPPADRGIVEVRARVGGEVVEKTCAFDLAKWSREVQDLMRDSNRPAWRVTAPCLR